MKKKKMILILILILVLNFKFILVLPFMISFGMFTFNYYSIFGDVLNFNFNLLETYECGFDSFHNKLMLYNLQFFNIGVSYMILISKLLLFLLDLFWFSITFR